MILCWYILQDAIKAHWKATFTNQFLCFGFLTVRATDTHLLIICFRVPLALSIELSAVYSVSLVCSICSL